MVSTRSGGLNNRAGRGQCCGQRPVVGAYSGATLRHGALGHVALDGRKPIELREPDAVGERVDQPGDVGFQRFGQAGRGRPISQRLGDRSGQRHELDPESGIYEPRLHAKILAWDDDCVVITSQNWLSADPSEAYPRKEIGIFLRASSVGRLVVEHLEAIRRQ
jgi:hypothetical protein